MPLNSRAVAALRAHRSAQAWEKRISRGAYDDQGLVFADELGGVLDLDMVSMSFAKAAKAVGVKSRGVSLHSLRHCAATTALQNGADVRTVAALLGHASPSTTLNVYGHVVAGPRARGERNRGSAQPSGSQSDGR